MKKNPKRKNKPHMVVDASNWLEMDGKNILEKKINSYLTCHFIARYDIPSDECLSYAQEIAAMDHSKDRKEDIFNCINQSLNYYEDLKGNGKYLAKPEIIWETVEDILTLIKENNPSHL